MRTIHPAGLLLVLSTFGCDLDATERKPSENGAGGGGGGFGGGGQGGSTARCGAATECVGESTEAAHTLGFTSITCGLSLDFQDSERAAACASLPEPCFAIVANAAVGREAQMAMIASDVVWNVEYDPDWSDRLLVGVYAPKCGALGFFVRIRKVSLAADGTLEVDVDHSGCGEFGDAPGQPYDLVVVDTAESFRVGCTRMTRVGCLPPEERACERFRP